MTERKAGKLFFILIFLASLPTVLSQPLNYSEIFREDWQKALTFIGENDAWIKPVLEKYNIPYPEAVAIVFPELVRYSAIMDKMEITILKTLYRNLGDDYADFSVGVFQVKPSFAELVRNQTPGVMGKKAKSFFNKRSSYKSDRDYRASIISDLDDPKTEFNYIIAFYLICRGRFNMDDMNEESKIKFLATAYNSGFWKNKDEILKMEDRKFFNTKLFKTDNYSYSEVSLFWYNNYINTRVN